MNTLFNIFLIDRVPLTILILLMLFTYGLVITSYHMSKQRLSLLCKPTHQKRLLYNFSARTKQLKILFLSLAIFCCILAGLQPQWDTQSKSTTELRQSRDLLIALDVSRSMVASDVTPHRLAHAKKVIEQIVNTLTAERFGLMVFSNTAIVLCPLTTDRDAFFMFLDSVDEQTLSSGATELDTALSQAMHTFQRSQQTHHKLLILITDGEDFSATTENTQKEALDIGLRVCTIGIGTSQGAPIPLYNAQGKQEGHLRDNNGTVVISRLNEQLLSRMAQKLGGLYLHATENDNVGNAIKQWVEQFEKNQSYEERKPSHHIYHYCAALSFIFLIFEWLL
jgi:Ca-activated chloride channel homolog